MISLVPGWAKDYEGFWIEVRRRNLWFIKLRYGAVGILIAFALIVDYYLNFSFTFAQTIAVYSITVIILTYNIILHKVRIRIKAVAGQFNVMHLSLIQISLDLASLMLLVHFTGGIESPLYFFFIFHMVIGSLILPGRVIYACALLSIAVFALMVACEFSGLIPHHALKGFIGFPLYDHPKFVLISITIFTFVMLVSVMFANGIAEQLYHTGKELYESLEKVQQTERSKQKYIMAVVHEIKSPLAAVNSFLNLILKGLLGPVNEQVRERLERSLIRTNEAIELINDVLNISRLRLLDELDLEKVRIQTIIDRLGEKYKPAAEGKNISLDIANSVPDTVGVNGDERLLELVISNLISNAVKYTGAGGIIKIDARENYGMIEIKVIDNGIGIPESDLDSIFGDFYRASNVKRSKYEGTGLGLSLVKRVVEKHNGNIRTYSPSELSEPGRPGTAMVITLPVTTLETE